MVPFAGERSPRAAGGGRATGDDPSGRCDDLAVMRDA
jgi:hypothetical protein